MEPKRRSFDNSNFKNGKKKKKKAVVKVRTMDETLKICMALVLTTKATNILVVH